MFCCIADTSLPVLHRQQRESAWPAHSIRIIRVVCRVQTAQRAYLAAGCAQLLQRQHADQEVDIVCKGVCARAREACEDRREEACNEPICMWLCTPSFAHKSLSRDGALLTGRARAENLLTCRTCPAPEDSRRFWPCSASLGVVRRATAEAAQACTRRSRAEGGQRTKRTAKLLRQRQAGRQAIHVGEERVEAAGDVNQRARVCAARLACEQQVALCMQGFVRQACLCSACCMASRQVHASLCLGLVTTPLLGTSSHLALFSNPSFKWCPSDCMTSCLRPAWQHLASHDH